MEHPVVSTNHSSSNNNNNKSASPASTAMYPKQQQQQQHNSSGSHGTAASSGSSAKHQPPPRVTVVPRKGGPPLPPTTIHHNNNPAGGNSSNGSSRLSLTGVLGGGGRSKPKQTISTVHNNNNNHNLESSTPQHSPTTIVPTAETLETRTAPKNNSNNTTTATAQLSQEQALFEQRLTSEQGLAVRKINHYGKASLRFVKCGTRAQLAQSNNEATPNNSSTGSVASSFSNYWGRRLKQKTAAATQTTTTNNNNRPTIEVLPHERYLQWGKQKLVQLPLGSFLRVHKGKTTNRTLANTQVPANQLLSIITNDPVHTSLDIEAPTVQDRDKFAAAFSHFLQIPLVEEGGGVVTTTQEESCEPILTAEGSAWKDTIVTSQQQQHLPPLPPTHQRSDSMHSRSLHSKSSVRSSSHQSSGMHSSLSNQQQQQQRVAPQPKAFVETAWPPMSDHSNMPPKSDQLSSSSRPKVNDDDDEDDVSSITGHGYDQELVEELHHALQELRRELEESRAEAARAVKVAEQAIQSAERSDQASNSNNNNWQNTVTHKAAEAAALAQKRSAQAMAKQRIAEEQLQQAVRATQFWKQQAVVAEDDVGHWQTVAAAATVQRAAMEHAVQERVWEETRRHECVQEEWQQTNRQQRALLDAAMERNRVLQAALEQQRMNAPGDEASSSMPADLQSVHADMMALRQQFELLQKETADELAMLMDADAPQWMRQLAVRAKVADEKTTRLSDQLARERAARRKLLHELQDLRGYARVYCRLKPSVDGSNNGLVSLASFSVLTLHREEMSEDDLGGSVSIHRGPTSYEFDGIFSPDSLQSEVFSEVEAVCLSVLEGYNICVMGFGQGGCGKTHTILGDYAVRDRRVKFQSYGVELEAMKQIFEIADRRSGRYKDTFTVTIVEVHNERLCDLIAGTSIGEQRGKIVTAETSSKSSSSKPKLPESDETASTGKQTKLEIRTDIHGETIVQGLRSVQVQSFKEYLAIWEECLAARVQRLVDAELDVDEYEQQSHVISTIKVESANITTGLGTVGRIQFVDLASSDVSVLEKDESEEDLLSEPTDWKFASKSLQTLQEVVKARSQYARDVPYRNSTLTHLLRDSIEHDTKVVLMACISCDPAHGKETAATLRFAAKMRKLNVGKATKHMLTPP